VKLEWTVTDDETHPDPTSKHATALSGIVAGDGSATTYSIGRAEDFELWIPIHHGEVVGFKGAEVHLGEHPSLEAAMQAAQEYEDQTLPKPRPDSELTDSAGLDGQECARCGDVVLTVSTRQWCDGCEVA
jgi:hypothetical protein